MPKCLHRRAADGSSKLPKKALELVLWISFQDTNGYDSNLLDPALPVKEGEKEEDTGRGRERGPKAKKVTNSSWRAADRFKAREKT